MRISVWGLGYVGCVTLACLASRGHRVTGLDVNPTRLAQVRAGQPPIVEPSLAALLHEHAPRISVTDRPVEAVSDSEVALVCVGTPQGDDGHLDLTPVQQAVATIDAAVRQTNRTTPLTVAIRSTVPPGTCARLASRAGAHADPDRGARIRVVSAPEFLREGSAVQDFLDPALTVVGVLPTAVGAEPDHDAAAPMMAVFEGLPGHRAIVPVDQAEMLKLVFNAWHALKITFANEIGATCAALGIDGPAVMDLLCQDRKLNLSSAYLRPGFAFGGACLPKDLSGLQSLAASVAVGTPVLNAIPTSNAEQAARALTRILALRPRRVAFLGISFKAGTDDVRCSPKLDLCRALVDAGVDVRVHDANVLKSVQDGINPGALLPRLGPLRERLTDDLAGCIREADLIVIANAEPALKPLADLLRPDQAVFELERLGVPLPCPRYGVT